MSDEELAFFALARSKYCKYTAHQLMVMPLPMFIKQKDFIDIEEANDIYRALDERDQQIAEEKKLNNKVGA